MAQRNQNKQGRTHSSGRASGGRERAGEVSASQQDRDEQGQFAGKSDDMRGRRQTGGRIGNTADSGRTGRDTTNNG